ncbi:ArsR/SmtB family transcription factor [Flagellimonas meridianipacifica]|uniref:DNA-binding transcriptional ArsR family regulator n=1 Tax=Flagellimonas meridianipacifica TaxID=1080225 RepID=A0A2T0MAT3_9FLAO|nr:helix-turn-helix transcriptional regulator [Allomuricauda pacifica]PRX54595.1 DNA-binding transcriptional ArsR family regulator [Allomuricauda pacifica]
MDEEKFISTASLLCEPSRAKIVWSLLDGRAYTASELALVADLSATSVSNHLSKLLNGDIVKVDVQGRHRYYSFANPEVAYAVESLANFANQKPTSKPDKPSTKNDIKYCRTCYDHLAGKLGVQITDKLISKKIIQLQDKTFVVTENGKKFFEDFGLDLAELIKQRRYFAKACLDWSERKYHISGSLGAAILDKVLELDWLRKTKNSRAIVITSLGQIGLKETFELELS